MVNPLLAGSIALMISTGAGVFVAPKAAAYIDAHADGWCAPEADASAHAKTRHAKADARASARSARWLCSDEDEEEDDAQESDDEGWCEEHGTRHRAHAKARVRPEVEASASVDVHL